MRSKIKQVAMAATLVFLSSWALAGLVQPAPILIILNPDLSGSAQGDMVTARFSDNDVEFIGCGIRTITGPGGVFQFGFCQATDADEQAVFCSTQNVDLLDAMKATADYSFLTFAFDADGACTRVGFSTQSIYLPAGVGEDDSFENHTHEYLTGEGIGHNNMSASTSSPIAGE